MKNRDLQKIMIISTATPRQVLTSSQITRPGKTGLVISHLTGGGYHYMDNKPDMEKLQRHIGNNGWVVITGHGKRTGGFTEITGESLGANGQEIRVGFTVKDYVDVIMMPETLNKNDHINILLYVCHGGSRGDSKDEISFAEQLQRELKLREISSHIIAVVGTVKRISSIPEDTGYITCHVSRGSRMIVLDANQAESSSCDLMGALIITKEGIKEPEQPYFNKIFHAGGEAKQIIEHKMSQLIDDNLLPTEETFIDFMKNREQAKATILADRFKNYIIHLSPDLEYEVSYRVDGRVLCQGFNDVRGIQTFLLLKNLTSDLGSSNEGPAF